MAAQSFGSRSSATHSFMPSVQKFASMGSCLAAYIARISATLSGPHRALPDTQ